LQVAFLHHAARVVRSRVKKFHAEDLLERRALVAEIGGRRKHRCQASFFPWADRSLIIQYTSVVNIMAACTCSAIASIVKEKNSQCDHRKPSKIAVLSSSLIHGFRFGARLDVRKSN
jgi:hypothetical protein